MIDDRAIFIEAIVDRNEQLERENLELRRDCESLRVTLQASTALSRRLFQENRTLRVAAKLAREHQRAGIPQKQAA